MDAVIFKQAIYDRVAPHLKHVPLHPNLITLAAFGIMLLAGACVFRGHLIWAGGLILASGVVDFLDGAVARARSRTTRFGALLDRVTDRACDCVAMAALIAAGYADLILGLYVLMVVPLASYTSACLEAATGTTVGERLSLRAVRIVVLALACFGGWINAGMLLLAVLGTYSTGSRLFTAYRLLRP